MSSTRNGDLAARIGALLEQGLAHHREQRLGEARASYLQALELQPGHPAALHMLGLVALAAREYAEAERLIGEAIAASPEQARFHLSLGNLHRQMRRPREAIGAYRRAITLDPGLFEAHYALAHTLHHGGEIDAALEVYRTARAMQPAQPALLVNMAAAYNRVGRLQEARECAEAAVAADPQMAAAHGNLANTLSELGEWAQATEAYRRCLELAPDSPMVHANLGSCLLRQGELDRAAEAFDAALAGRPGDVTSLAMRAAIHNERGEQAARDRLLDFDRLIAVDEIATPAGWASPAGFHRALADYLLAHPSLRADPDSQTTRGGEQSGALGGADNPAMAALLEAIRARIVRRFRELGDETPMGRVPERWRMDTWATVLHSDGHQVPHIHPTGWMSGVYYVSCPEDASGTADAGSIEFGRPPGEYGFAAPPATRTLAPAPGMLVLFPSYFFHRTVPFTATAPRISIAFDVVRVLHGGPPAA